MKVMLFNCKLTLTSNDTIKLDNTVTERNLLYIILLPQTVEHVNRDGCSAPVCVMSLAQSCGHHRHRSTAAAVNIDAEITQKRQWL